MAIVTGDNIEANHYTTALGRVAAVLGNGSGQSGYGQVLDTPASYFNVSTNDELITADHWNKLSTDIGTARYHQVANAQNTFSVSGSDTEVIGANASFSAVQYSSSVAVIQVLYPGENVTAATITIAAPDDGTNTATAQVNITGGQVTSVTITNVGGGYIDTPSFTVAGSFTVAPVFRVILGAPSTTVYSGQSNNDGILDIYSRISTIEANASTANSVNTTLTTGRQFTSSTRFSQWGGDGDPDDTIYCELDVVFDGGYSVTNSTTGASVTASGADHRRHFFNTGGEIRLSFTSTDFNDKDSNWNTMFNNVGSVVFRKNDTTVTGSGLARDGATDVDGNGGTDSAVGNYQLTTSYQTIFIKYGTGVYSTNNVTVQAKRVGTDTIRFAVYFNDVAEGNPNFDERVLVDGGSQQAGIDLKRSTGVCSIPEPSQNVFTEFQNT